MHRIARYEGMNFDESGAVTDFGITKERLKGIVRRGQPFVTSGCPHCNRPFYNEKPSGSIYNFPRKLTFSELSTTERQLGL